MWSHTNCCNFEFQKHVCHRCTYNMYNHTTQLLGFKDTEVKYYHLKNAQYWNDSSIFKDTEVKYTRVSPFLNTQNENDFSSTKIYTGIVFSMLRAMWKKCANGRHFVHCRCKMGSRSDTVATSMHLPRFLQLAGSAWTKDQSTAGVFHWD